MGIIFMVNTDMPMMYKRFMQEEQNNQKSNNEKEGDRQHHSAYIFKL